jgi:hypothetical protein
VQSELLRVCKVVVSYDIRSSSANPGGAYAHPQVCVAPPLNTEFKKTMFGYKFYYTFRFLK